MEEYILNAFDLVKLSFRTEASPERVQRACDYAQALYEELKIHGGSLTRDRLLAILLLGVTDDLLQQKEAQKLVANQQSMALLQLVKKIDETILPESQ